MKIHFRNFWLCLSFPLFVEKYFYKLSERTESLSVIMIMKVNYSIPFVELRIHICSVEWEIHSFNTPEIIWTETGNYSQFFRIIWHNQFIVFLLSCETNCFNQPSLGSERERLIQHQILIFGTSWAVVTKKKRKASEKIWRRAIFQRECQRKARRKAFEVRDSREFSLSKREHHHVLFVRTFISLFHAIARHSISNDVDLCIKINNSIFWQMQKFPWAREPQMQISIHLFN